MNTTMASVDQIKAARSVDIRNRQNWYGHRIIRKRQTEIGNGNGNGNGRRFGNSRFGSGGRGRGRGRGRFGDNNNDDKDGKDNGRGKGDDEASSSTTLAVPESTTSALPQDTPSVAPPNTPSSAPLDIPTAATSSISSAAPSTIPSATSQTAPPASSQVTTSASPEGAVTSIVMMTSVVMVTSIAEIPAPSSTSLLQPPSTTDAAESSASQSGKGIDESSTTVPPPTSVPEPAPTVLESEIFNQETFNTARPTIAPPEIALSQGVGPTPSVTPISLPSTQSPGVTMKPMTQNLLIAAGTIGALIIIFTAIYMFARIKKIDLFAIFRDRELRKGGSNNWYGWRRRELVNLPPKYSSEAAFTSFTFTSDEKKPYFQPASAEYFPQQEAYKDGSHRDLPQYQPVISPVSPVSPMSVVFPPLHVANPDSRLSQAASTPGFQNVVPQYVAGSSPGQGYLTSTQTYNNSNPKPANTMDDSLYTYLGDFNNTIRTNTTIVSNNTVNDAYDPAQREVNHLSYLSSLSSGFGDQILIPRVPPTPFGPDTPRKSTLSRKYSWAQTANNRDTQYTNVSVESAPHYRTVNSWVSQQAGRTGKYLPTNDEIPQMPNMPYPLQIHQRNRSSNPAFRQHPGDEIELERRSRISSQILDRKTGIN